jgi:hypothetical protein
MKHPPALVLALLLLAAVPADAHHSLAYYNTASYRTIEGTVKSFEWSNPHTSLTLLVETEAGIVEEWKFEGGNPRRLDGEGFHSNAISEGERIAVHYNAKRDGSIGGFFLAVTKSDGIHYALRRFRGLRQEQ